MWFDAHARLAELEAIPAVTDPEPPPVSQLSQLSQPPAPVEPVVPAPNVVDVADVATPTALETRSVALAPQAFPHGTACNLGDFPKTWTGRVVSLADWRLLTHWERQGPDNRIRNGKSREWEAP